MENPIIRREREYDWYDTEYLTKKAFWNLHVPGCNEHYLVHLLRKSPDYLPELSRMAELNGRAAGAIWYSKARVEGEGGVFPVLTFGPLCVAPEYQRQGIGGRLLTHTLDLAREAGHKAVIIFGNPDYYPRFGFKTCDQFGITDKTGGNISAFMGLELIPGAFRGVTGKFYESPVFEECNSPLSEEYDQKFPQMPKLKLPGQWET